MMKKIILFLLLFCAALSGQGQEYNGTKGLLNAPSAEMDSAGTFRGGVAYLDKDLLPDMTPYGDGTPFNTAAYTVGISAFDWMQLSYTGVLVKMHKNHDTTQPVGYFNEDRHVSLKFRPIKEGRWWPAVALGWDDFGSFKWLKFDKSLTGNNFFEHIYIAGSKHFNIRGWELGTHLAYRHYPSDKNKDRRGMAGGLTLRPAFSPTLRLIAEYDGVGVNVGGDVLLWRHWFAQAALVHGRGFMGGVSYHYTIKF